MRIRPSKPTDVVFGAAMKVVDDCIGGLDAVIKDLVGYNSAFVNMAKALRDVKRNLERHALNKKWNTKEDKAKLRRRIRQISAAMAINLRMSVICATTLNSVIKLVATAKKSEELRDAFDNWSGGKDD